MAEMAKAFSLKLPPVDEVIKTITAAEGIPVVAHLGEAPFGDLRFTQELYSMGVRGFEVWHPGNKPDARAYLSDFCDANGLYKTGGTDHSAELGGCKDAFPEHNLPDDCGGMPEEDFNKLYTRALG